MDDVDDDLGMGRNKLPKVAKVKNKMPAPVQITAEQLLREAKERELELVQPPPKQKISDEAELKDYQMRKRKGFEDNIRKNRSVITNWLKYASWEESQQALRNARSVYERALDVDHRNITIWLKYAEMEMRNKQINSARNIWDRAVTILPRANQFWYKYTYMEELLINMAGCRQVFERWMEWEPEEQAWHSYINFELRYKELNRARIIYERFVIVHPEIKNWIKYAKFEEKNGFSSSARTIYERSVDYFGDEHINEQLLIAFARFEEGQKEHERARVIYKFALDRLPKERCEEIYRLYTMHEKKFGDRSAIEDVIVSKRRFHYEEQVKANPFNYDAWFDYLRLAENEGDPDTVRELYERAISNIPPSREKRHWRRYIYLWINYALYEELEANNTDRTRQVYQACLQLLPHKRFTFAKVWYLFAKFEIRQRNLMAARKIMGNAIGKCPKDKLFRSYIELELQLREFDRCRILYEKFLEFSPENCTTWMKYAELETLLNDLDRARAIYQLSISQPQLDMPEVLWKSFIDFETKLAEYENVRNLYGRLLQRTQHVKVWISFAQFELSMGEDDSLIKAREVFKKANRTMKSNGEKEERVILLEAWKQFEQEFGDDNSLKAVEKMQPSKIRRTRKVEGDGEGDSHWEEYFDYIFPDDEGAKPNLRLLAMAKNWKKQAESTLSTTDQNDTDSDYENDDKFEKHDEICRENYSPNSNFCANDDKVCNENNSESDKLRYKDTNEIDIGDDADDDDIHSSDELEENKNGNFNQKDSDSTELEIGIENKKIDKQNKIISFQNEPIINFSEKTNNQDLSENSILFSIINEKKDKNKDKLDYLNIQNFENNIGAEQNKEQKLNKLNSKYNIDESNIFSKREIKERSCSVSSTSSNTSDESSSINEEVSKSKSSKDNNLKNDINYTDTKKSTSSKKISNEKSQNDNKNKKIIQRSSSSSTNSDNEDKSVMTIKYLKKTDINQKLKDKLIRDKRIEINKTKKRSKNKYSSSEESDNNKKHKNIELKQNYIEEYESRKQDNKSHHYRKQSYNSEKGKIYSDKSKYIEASSTDYKDYLNIDKDITKKSREKLNEDQKVKFYDKNEKEKYEERTGKRSHSQSIENKNNFDSSNKQHK